MTKLLDTKEFLDTVCELLNQGETSIAVPVAGGSMVPFLIHGDTVYLDLLDSPVKRGDIVLYTRTNGRYILHRVYKVNKDGSCIMVGDAQQELELLPSLDMIHARVTAARHQGKLIRPGGWYWTAYRYLWLWLLPFRHRLMHLRGKLGKRK